MTRTLTGNDPDHSSGKQHFVLSFSPWRGDSRVKTSDSRGFRGPKIAAALFASISVANITAGCSQTGDEAIDNRVGQQTSTTLSGAEANYGRTDQLWINLWSAFSNPGDQNSWAKLDGFVSKKQIENYKISFAGQVGVSTTHHLIRTAKSTDEVQIDDCLEQRNATSTSFDGTHLIGKMEWVDDKWKLSDINLSGKDIVSSACVPKGVNEEVIGAYREFTKRSSELTRRPDPSSSEIDELTTDSYQVSYRNWMSELKDKGEYVVSNADGVELKPVVYRFRAGGVSIADCVEAFEEYGRFKTDGTRVTRALSPGSTTAYELDFVFENGQWKVADLRQADEVSCSDQHAQRAIDVVG